MVSLTQQGKKHQPLVELDGDNIVITIGRDIEHPMEKVHLIETLDLLSYTKAGLIRIKTFDFEAGNKPKITFSVSDLTSGTYKVQSRCNIHGTWDDDFVI